jgi:hypothetical protein
VALIDGRPLLTGTQVVFYCLRAYEILPDKRVAFDGNGLIRGWPLMEWPYKRVAFDGNGLIKRVAFDGMAL